MTMKKRIMECENVCVSPTSTSGGMINARPGAIPILAAVCLIGASFSLHSAAAVTQLVEWDFENETGLALDGLDFGFSEVSSVRLDLVAIGGSFNLTGSGFGIDSPGADDSDAFDGIFSPEGLQFSFSSSGTLTGLKFDRFTESANDAFSLSLGGGPGKTYTKADLTSDNSLLLNQDFLAGETFTLTWESGNGFGLESISAQMTPVPEPEEYALIATGGLVLFAAIRRRQLQRKKNPDPAFFS